MGIEKQSFGLNTLFQSSYLPICFWQSSIGDTDRRQNISTRKTILVVISITQGITLALNIVCTCQSKCYTIFINDTWENLIITIKT